MQIFEEYLNLVAGGFWWSFYYEKHATATTGPVLISLVQSGFGHFFGPCNWTLEHYVEDNESGSHDNDFISVLSDSSKPESSAIGSGDDELLTNAEVRESHSLLHIILVVMADTFFYPAS